jgi:dihydrofolate reductase
MAKLIYSAITSLDGYTVDADGSFGWAAPDAEVHQFVNDLERGVGTYLYGRRMYETMRYWETAGGADDDSPQSRDYAAIWRGAAKVVYSTTLREVNTADTVIESSFNADAVRRLKQTAVRDLSVGGPGLAVAAFAAGLVDEVHLFLNPIAVGGGTPALPRDARLQLALQDIDRFENGVVHVHYRVR